MADVDEGGGNWGEMTVTFEIADGGIHRMVASTMQSHDGDQAHEIDLGHDGYESVIRRKDEVLERKNTPGNGGTSESEERVSERFRCFLNKNYRQDQWSRIEKKTVEDDICDVFIQPVNADDDPLSCR